MSNSTVLHGVYNVGHSEDRAVPGAGAGWGVCRYISIFLSCLGHWRTSLVAQTVKRLPTMRETQVQSLGQEDLLEKEMATHSSTLAWKIPWMEKLCRLQSMGSQESDMTERLHFHFLGALEQVMSFPTPFHSYLFLKGV